MRYVHRPKPASSPASTRWCSARPAVDALGAAAFLLVGLGAVGWMVLAETDDQWEHTPEVHGFRPAAGTGCHRQVARTEGRPLGRRTVASCARRRQR